jgi:hypothetical protein
MLYVLGLIAVVWILAKLYKKGAEAEAREMADLIQHTQKEAWDEWRELARPGNEGRYREAVVRNRAYNSARDKWLLEQADRDTNRDNPQYGRFVPFRWHDDKLVAQFT